MFTEKLADLKHGITLNDFATTLVCGVDENGNKIIKTTQEARSTLSILCECNITYNDKTQHYTFEINNSYDRELTEEQKDCDPICKKICNEKLEEMKADK